jgi:hypothetical protein
VADKTGEVRFQEIFCQAVQPDHRETAVGIGFDILSNPDLKIEEVGDQPAVEKLEFGLLGPATDRRLALRLEPQFIVILADPALRSPIQKFSAVLDPVFELLDLEKGYDLIIFRRTGW